MPLPITFPNPRQEARTMPNRAPQVFPGADYASANAQPPPFTGQMPAGAMASPAFSGQMPAGAMASPAFSGQMPAGAMASPAFSGQMPAGAARNPNIPTGLPAQAQAGAGRMPIDPMRRAMLARALMGG